MWRASSPDDEETNFEIGGDLWQKEQRGVSSGREAIINTTG
jgi:hypothetical protein